MVRRDDLTGARLNASVKNACNEAGYYRIEIEDVEPGHRQGHDPEFIEKLLSTFECRAERALDRVLVDPPPWDAYDRFHLVNFTALQFVRGWRYRRYLNEVGTLTMRQILRSDPEWLRRMACNILRDSGDPLNEASIATTIEEIVGPSGPKLVSSQPNAIQTGFEFALESLAEQLWMRAMRIVHFDEANPLLISDNPVVTWSPDCSQERVVPLARAATITVPVSPTAALSFARSGVDSTSKAGRVRARQINTAVADTADRWIYFTPGTDPLAALDVSTKRPPGLDEDIGQVAEDQERYRELCDNRPPRMTPL